MKVVLSILTPLFAYLALCTGNLLMLELIIDYTSFKTDIHFLKLKQDYLDNNWWKAAFYIHVFTSIFALLAGFTQFSSYILKHHRKIHKLAGRLYVINILFINFPAAMIMAVYANGLWPSKLAFILLDSLWFYFTLKAVLAIQKGRIEEHKRFMIRSYALTFSAITLRSWKIILLYAFHPDPLTLYMIQAWIGFVPNLLFAEWLILSFPGGQKKYIQKPDYQYSRQYESDNA